MGTANDSPRARLTLATGVLPSLADTGTCWSTFGASCTGEASYILLLAHIGPAPRVGWPILAPWGPWPPECLARSEFESLGLVLAS